MYRVNDSGRVDNASFLLVAVCMTAGSSSGLEKIDIMRHHYYIKPSNFPSSCAWNLIIEVNQLIDLVNFNLHAFSTIMIIVRTWTLYSITDVKIFLENV